MGVPKGRGKKIRWTKDEEKLLRQLAQEGVTVGQIAVQLGRSRAAVIGRTTKLKVPVKHSYGKRSVLAEEI